MTHWITKYVVVPLGIGIANFFLVSWLFERTLKCGYYPELCGRYPVAEENIFTVLAFPTLHYFNNVGATFFEAEIINAIFWGFTTIAIAFCWTRLLRDWVMFRVLFKPSEK